MKLICKRGSIAVRDKSGHCVCDKCKRYRYEVQIKNGSRAEYVSKWRKPDQIIQPWQFGDKAVKKTCLWLKGLPALQHTAIVTPEFKVYNSKTNSSGKSKYPINWTNGASAKERSKTFPGIANAMAEQWG